MTLREQRVLFSKLISEHLLWLNEPPGYEACFDEGTERITEKDPTSDHIVGSFHHKGLAMDINLYKIEKRLVRFSPEEPLYDVIWLKDTEDHKFSGERWESRHPLCSWGGRWGDGGHYSLGEGK